MHRLLLGSLLNLREEGTTVDLLDVHVLCREMNEIEIEGKSEKESRRRETEAEGSRGAQWRRSKATRREEDENR
jgi:hypothetical protein